MSDQPKPLHLLTETRVTIEDPRHDPASLLSDTEKDAIRAEEFARKVGGSADQVSVLHLEPETIRAMMEAGLAHATVICGIVAGMKLPRHISVDVAVVAMHHAIVRVAEAITDPMDRVNGRRLGESMFHGIEQLRRQMMQEDGNNAN